MIKNVKKYKFDKNSLINFLFNIFPLIILLSSGYITVYIAFFIIYGYKFLFSNKIRIRIFLFASFILCAIKGWLKIFIIFLFFIL